MYKFGLVVPSSNPTIEAEFHSSNPTIEAEFQKFICETEMEGSVHSNRMVLQETTVKGLKKMEKQGLEAAKKLSHAEVDVICYACTSGSLFKGLDHDKKIKTEFENETDIPTVVTSGAVIDALKKMGIKKVSIATPYTEELNNLEKEFFEKNGIEVLKIEGFGITENIKISYRTPEEAHELARKVDLPESEGIFISCTNLRSIEIIEKLEKGKGKPVITSTTSSIWKMLVALGFDEEIEGFGRLFRTK